MTNVDVENKLLEKIREKIKDSIRFANTRQFVNLAVEEKLNRLEEEKDKSN